MVESGQKWLTIQICIEETGPIFPTVGVTVVTRPPSLRSCLSHVCCQMSNGHPEPDMWSYNSRVSAAELLYFALCS